MKFQRTTPNKSLVRDAGRTALLIVRLSVVSRSFYIYRDFTFRNAAPRLTAWPRAFGRSSRERTARPDLKPRRAMPLPGPDVKPRSLRARTAPGADPGGGAASRRRPARGGIRPDESGAGDSKTPGRTVVDLVTVKLLLYSAQAGSRVYRGLACAPGRAESRAREGRTKRSAAIPRAPCHSSQ